MMVRGHADKAGEVRTIDWLNMKYSWQSPKGPIQETSEAEVAGDQSAFVSKSTFV